MQEVITFKIPQGISKILVAERELRNTKQTNSLVKVYGFYFALKSVTTAGKIQNYRQQLQTLCAYTKRKSSSFYEYLRKAEKLNLLTRKDGDIHLTSWEKVFKNFGLVQKSFINIEYDITNKLITPEYLIVCSAIKENKDSQAFALCKKIENNPLLKYELGITGAVTTSTIQRLQHEQKITFMHQNNASGSDTNYDALHSLNVDFERSLRKLRQDFGFKSNLSATYLKRQLVIRGLASVSHRITTSSLKNRKWKLNEAGKKTEQLTGYDNQKHQTVWRQPDLISLNLKML